MIKSFKHKGLKELLEKRKTSKIGPRYQKRLLKQLRVLDEAKEAESMNLPGWKFHSLSGTYLGFFSVSVNKNWRLIFRFEENEPHDVDFVDYH